MLTELQIANFAIIEKQTISFGKGLNVISGETGAGKSIILQALELVLGGRASSQAVREGSESLEVQALIDLDAVPKELRAALPEIIEGEELLVSRSVNAAGKGKVFLNGKLASASLLADVVGKVISICGQGQQMRLLERDYHTAVIDTFGGIEPAREKYQNAFKQWKAKAAELAEIEQRMDEREARREELGDRVKELRAVKLSPGRRAELEQQVKLMQNSGKIVEECRALSDHLTSDDGVLSRLSEVGGLLDRLRHLVPHAGELEELLNGARANIDELDAAVEKLVRGVQLDQDELAEREGELAEIARLQRKYRCDDSGLLTLLEESERELSLIEDARALDALRAEVKKLQQTMLQLGTELSKQRRNTGEKLSKAVSAELAELDMPHARLSVKTEPCEPALEGCEILELLIATNKGESPKPLRQIASGGELSRIMLVLKKVLREKSGVNVLIFDEVDTGVSGKVARAVGEKLSALAEHSQVICITHLPQIASLADKHLLVEKKVGKRTMSVVKELTKEEKVDEIARMLAGYKVTEAARESARELIASK